MQVRADRVDDGQRDMSLHCGFSAGNFSACAVFEFETNLARKIDLSLIMVSDREKRRQRRSAAKRAALVAQSESEVSGLSNGCWESEGELEAQDDGSTTYGASANVNGTATATDELKELGACSISGVTSSGITSGIVDSEGAITGLISLEGSASSSSSGGVISGPSVSEDDSSFCNGVPVGSDIVGGVSDSVADALCWTRFTQTFSIIRYESRGKLNRGIPLRQPLIRSDYESMRKQLIQRLEEAGHSCEGAGQATQLLVGCWLGIAPLVNENSIVGYVCAGCLYFHPEQACVYSSLSRSLYEHIKKYHDNVKEVSDIKNILGKYCKKGGGVSIYQCHPNEKKKAYAEARSLKQRAATALRKKHPEACEELIAGMANVSLDN